MRRLLISAAIFMFILAGCANSADEPVIEVINTAYTYSSEGNFSDILELFIIGVDETKLADRKAEIYQVWQEVTHNGTVKDVEIIKTKIDGGKADVTLKLFFQDGSVQDDEVVLLKDGDFWKISIE